MRKLIDLSDKKYLVTGASSGIGRATAIMISQLGGTVICVGRNSEELERTMKELESITGHMSFEFDLANTGSIAGLLNEVVSIDKRKLNGFVHCAGISPIWPLRTIDYNKMDYVMRVNFYSFIELTKSFSSKNISDGGSIVSISSTASLTGEKCQTIYAASKAAMDSAVTCLAQEICNKGIRINTIRPGLIETPMTTNFSKNVDNNFLQTQIDKQLLGIGKPEDIASMVVFLLSDAAKFITGHSYFVDGGRL